MDSIDIEPMHRHDRVWLDHATWRAHVRDEVDIAPVALLDEWISRGRALVVRRREPNARPDDCFLGVALPLAFGRARIPLIVDHAAVRKIAKPLRLDQVIDAAPTEHRASLHALQVLGEEIDTTFRVYGSFAWQAISGEPCVKASSDLDLLWDVKDMRQATEVITLLLDWEIEARLRADGEARFANGDAIAWRELTTASSRVLVKSDDGVSLRALPFGDAATMKAAFASRRSIA
jgi:phosphoribosyl-dephospho-CoA transferase